jgi:hypothetical protein
MARSARGSLSLAYQSDSRRRCRSMEEIPATDGSRSSVSVAQERIKDSTAVSSIGTTGESARAGGVSRHLLKRSASEYSPAQALKRLSELYSADIVLPTVEGREIWLRRISKREDDQERLLQQLRVELPERLEPIQILKCSADSAIA